jgi:REP element-mobilizing transposase RayT
MKDPPSRPQRVIQAVAQGAVKPRFGEVRIRNRGRLPHWEKDAGLYFITFRLADSLPQAVLEEIAERHRILESAKLSGLKLMPHQKVLVEKYSPKRIEEYFDSGMGACHLRDSRIANLVVNALRFGDGQKYRLLAWCIMPNHVHVICRLFPGQELAGVLRAWKSYSARMANRNLGRTGSFWQREYFDRLIRDGNELERAIRYVEKNPECAGLKCWKWVWSTGLNARATAGLESGATAPAKSCARN